MPEFRGPNFEFKCWWRQCYLAALTEVWFGVKCWLRSYILNVPWSLGPKFGVECRLRSCHTIFRPFPHLYFQRNLPEFEEPNFGVECQSWWLTQFCHCLTEIRFEVKIYILHIPRFFIPSLRTPFMGFSQNPWIFRSLS